MTDKEGSDVVTSEVRGDTSVIRLNRPHHRNALTVPLARRLIEELTLAEQGSRVAIVTGEGRAFSSGGDLDALMALAADGSQAAVEAIYNNYQRLVLTIRELDIPVIAAVNGPALGAGLDLAVACDYRLVAESGRFSSSWISMCLIPGMGGAYTVTEAIGSSRATDLLLTGRAVSAAEAVEIGLAHSAHPDAELLDAALAKARELSVPSKRAVAATKTALRRASNVSLRAELEKVAEVQGDLLQQPEFRERAEHFVRQRAEGRRSAAARPATPTSAPVGPSGRAG
ncbi:enoyl-CoA hydratase/isomerase family protein [Pseudofrankia asymbiotica]|uniref:Enoyl-CoA hydratase n=1 Tax=Pseudofrankia asymbiotica TaxID=1834516 RepID=A0A1V2I7P7_9ACTN|nr:enoyl-CoA hydratase/isomerase family protein [Pseudofrankia asymbiotica]ONH26405.1 hypothetical protein BL253_24795 [Pseudofrankia asymbiotica]